MHAQCHQLEFPNPDKPEQNKEKTYHESTKVRRHESLNVILFRAFNLSCFAALRLEKRRDCLLELSVGKNLEFYS